MKMFVRKHKGLMKIVDDKIVEVDNNLKNIKKRLGLRWNEIFNETNTRASLEGT